MTRPDILTSTCLLACHTAYFSDRHVKAVKRIFKYLLGTYKDCLTFNVDPDFKLSSIPLAMFADADWAADKISRRSMVGYTTVLCGNAMTFAAKHWPTPCLSTLEAEYIALTYAAKELLFIASIFTELKFAVLATPIPMLSDSAGAISFAENSVSNSNTKHIDLRHFHEWEWRPCRRSLMRTHSATFSKVGTRVRGVSDIGERNG